MKKLLFAVLVCTVATSAWAVELQWFGGAHDRAWTNPNNWVPSLVPTAGDRTKINGVWGNLGPIISTSGARVGEIFLSEGPPELAPQDLTVAAGGEVTTGSDGGVPYAGQVNIGYSSHNVGTLIMDGGTMNVTGHLWLGWAGKGILQMNSGTLNTMQMFAPGWNGGSAEIHLDGGILHTRQWWIGAGRTDITNYTFDITEGMWILDGYWADEVQELINAGKITGYGDPDAVIVSWNPVNEQTVVMIIPEPISVSLFGLGALLMRRRS